MSGSESRLKDVVNYLASHTSVGDEVTLTVVRGGDEVLIRITLEERPSNH